VWGDDYARHLERKGFIGNEQVRQYLQKQQMLRQEVAAERLKQQMTPREVPDTAQLLEDLQMLKMEFISHRQVVQRNMQILITWGKVVVALSTATAFLVLMHVVLGVGS
jgi:hypothetical protein